MSLISRIRNVADEHGWREVVMRAGAMVGLRVAEPLMWTLGYVYVRLRFRRAGRTSDEIQSLLSRSGDRHDPLLNSKYYPLATATKDRLYPEELARVSHTSRYYFAASLFKDAGMWQECPTHLDVACGVGYASELLSRHGEIEYVGVDIDPSSFRYGARHYDSGQYVRGDASRLPHPDDRFQTITCIETLEHVPDDGGVLAELERVLKPAGSLVIFVPNDETLPTDMDHKQYPHVNSYDFDEFVGLLEQYFPEADVSVKRQNRGKQYVDPPQPYGFTAVSNATEAEKGNTLIAHVDR